VDFFIYNQRGQLIRTIHDGQKAIGNWKLQWMVEMIRVPPAHRDIFHQDANSRFYVDPQSRFAKISKVFSHLFNLPDSFPGIFCLGQSAYLLYLSIILPYVYWMGIGWEQDGIPGKER
jgi:hypothetical protein